MTVYCLQLERRATIHVEVSHIMLCVPANREREATFDVRLSGFGLLVFERTARQHGLLRIIKCDGEEIIPIANEIFLCHYFMESELAL